ncbi:ATP-dependent nuclease [Paraclostridium bifermentans]|uniref:ATP-dependent nuclease n=1 Tax=Paraclostridium bifermentans TaxID=1490 RepID=UPI00359C4EDE
MKIKKLQVENFRLLKNLNLDLEDELSVIIGKNNCGKTSLLSVLNKFIGDKSSINTFSYDDFNFQFKKNINEYILDKSKLWETEDGISLTIFIEYDEHDDLSNISNLMLDLDPDNNIVVLKFEYVINEHDFKNMKQKFEEYKLKYEKVEELECFRKFISVYYKSFFKIRRKAVLFDQTKKNINSEEFIDLDKNKIDISKIISFKYISAHRSITNTENDNTLSTLSSRYYEKMEIDESQSKTIEAFQDALIETDSKLSEVYDDIFSDISRKVKKFGGMKKDETVIKVISSLQRRELLKGNTKVVYDDNNHYLPESYNGLGYLNLISMIFEIETLLKEFRKDNKKGIKPADVNLLFIEEPEAHTHPQMQYIFIKNIKDILKESCEEDENILNLQTIITTHSSHIVSECDFDDIKYFKKVKSSHIESKNLKQLEIEYTKEKDVGKAHFKFLKQYLTLNRAEIFFADKVILIEGDTERILIPAMMKKIDQEESKGSDLPLLSQNISIIEVGNYSQIFDKFISFIGIRTLIITDIDSYKQEIDRDEFGNPKKNTDGSIKYKDVASSVDESKYTSNGALKHFYEKELEQYKLEGKGDQLSFFKDLDYKNKTLEKHGQYWRSSQDGDLMLVYQVEETNDDKETYNARSFEDAFFHINRSLIINNQDKFNSLKNRKFFKEKKEDGIEYRYSSYELAIKCIQSKASFAMDVLLNSEENDNLTYSNWKIPKYIKDGLIWLKKN